MPHGVSDRYLESDAHEADGARGEGLLFCGSWDHVKGIAYVVATFERLHARGRALPLTVLGPGVPAEQVLRAFSERVRPFVRVVARIPEEDVIEMYRRHDVLLWTPTYEGFGLVLLEAMSQKMAVVATPIGCAPSLVRHGENGLMVPVRDPCHGRRRRAVDGRSVASTRPWRSGAAVCRGHDVARDGAQDARCLRAGIQGPCVSRLLSVGITTRNRPDALRACVASLPVIARFHPEILLFDDGSTVPAETQVADIPVAVRVIRDTASPGYIVGRNRLVTEATGAFVLLLDDDTRLLSAESVEAAIGVLRADPRVAAVAFAQAEADGRPWPAHMQPSVARVPAVVPSFIGFAHLLRRSVFLELSGYRESFEFYGEEKDYCLRLIDAGLELLASRCWFLTQPAR